jgi:predicted helicase
MIGVTPTATASTTAPTPSPFHFFARTGRELADLHLNYESGKRYKLTWDKKPGTAVDYRVKKMKKSADGTSIIYNDTLTLSGIPAEAWTYKLGNRSALDWIIDQYQVKTDARSGITSDPNHYSDDEQYIVKLIERVTNLSITTAMLVRTLSAYPL